jgi:hypothetical protein
MELNPDKLLDSTNKMLVELDQFISYMHKDYPQKCEGLTDQDLTNLFILMKISQLEEKFNKILLISN